jgi:hypothetical protein
VTITAEVGLVDFQIRKKSLLTVSSDAAHRAPQFPSLSQCDEVVGFAERLKLVVAAKATGLDEVAGSIPD